MGLLEQTLQSCLLAVAGKFFLWGGCDLNLLNMQDMKLLSHTNVIALLHCVLLYYDKTKIRLFETQLFWEL